MEQYHRKKVKQDVSKDIIFQAIDWNDSDEKSSDLDESEFAPGEYTVRVYGVTEDGKSIGIKVKNYTPHFFIKVNEYFNNTKKTVLLSQIKTKLGGYKYTLQENQCKVVEKEDYYGFRNHKKYKFLRLVFNSIIGFHICKKLLKKPLNGVTYKMYECNIDSILRICHIRKITPSSWIHIKAKDYSLNYDFNTQIGIELDWTKLNPVSDQNAELSDSICKMVQASYDIECDSADGSFPRPDRDPIIQIATAFKVYGSDDFYLKHIICLGECAPIEGENVVLETYPTEEEVLVAWTKLIQKTDPDILYQYNGDIFDGQYLYNRSVEMDCEDDFLTILSKCKLTKGELKEAKFSSGAYGTSKYQRLIMPGRINYDLCIYMNREFKLESYKLDDVAFKYLKQNKNPVTPQMIFEYYQSQDPEKVKTIAAYCIQDTLLPQRLIDRLDVIPINIEMSRETCVPIKYLVEKGQQIKVLSLIAKKTRERGYLIPYLQDSDYSENEKFEGATVLNPICGMYSECVTTLDFASLYPSIMRAHNLCYSSYIMDEKYDNIPGVEVLERDGHKFVQTINGEEYKTVLKELLGELYNKRKAVKKMMAREQNPFKKSVLNGRQNSLKVSMNSVYGFLAAHMLRCKPIASTVTYIGREMIEDTKNYCEENYQYNNMVLPEEKHIKIKVKDEEKMVEVKELQGYIPCDVLTDRGFREVLTIEKM